MPVRSLRSSVLKWPKLKQVKEALKRWAENIAKEHPEILKIGYFGSYAGGNWGVGSDLDVVIILAHSELPFSRRSTLYDATTLPVPVDLLVYTRGEWDKDNLAGKNPFMQKIAGETVWVYPISS